MLLGFKNVRKLRKWQTFKTTEDSHLDVLVMMSF